jgi:hypothetical protein
MLPVNLNDTDHNVRQFIAHTCSETGYVVSVKLHRLPTPFALVEMSRRKESAELAARFGGSTFGSCALVHLEHKAAQDTSIE